MRRKIESIIERTFARKARVRGGLALKFVSPGWPGAPDRVLFLPGGRTVFVEFKSPGKKPDPLQVLRHDELRELGFEVFVVDDIDRGDDVLRRVFGQFGADAQTTRGTVADDFTPARFLRARCESGDRSCTVAKQHLYERYQTECRQRGVRPVGAGAFNKAVRAQFPEAVEYKKTAPRRWLYLHEVQGAENS